jgi:hypothetical protein
MIHTQPLRHRLHRLARAIDQQAPHIQLTRGTLVRPTQATKHLLSKLHQPRT